MKRSTLVAAAVLAILVGIVYWLERDDGAGADVERVFDVPEDDIERVEIRRFGTEPVVIERKDGSFRVVQPVDAASDQREVDLILSDGRVSVVPGVPFPILEPRDDDRGSFLCA